jgi:PAS domain S-box-containing protein
MSNDTDQPLRYCAFITDLTERKQAETLLLENELKLRLATEKHLHDLQTYQRELDTQNEELQKASIALDKSRSHYIDLYDFAPVGYLTLTTEGIITEINLTATKLFSVERNKLVHQLFGQIIADEHKDRWHRFFLRAKQQGGKQSTELRINRKDGKVLFLHLDCQSMKSDDALPMLRIAVTDITERTLAEATLRESEARLSLVVEEVNAGYWDWDLVSNTVYLSPEWKRQLGFNSTELTSREPKEDRLHPDDRALIKAANENFIAGRQPDYNLQFRLRHKDGSYRWIHCRGALLCDPDGHPTRMLGLNLDITAYKQAQ